MSQLLTRHVLKFLTSVVMTLIITLGVTAQSPSVMSGKQLLDAGQVKEAIVALKRVTSADKNDADAWRYLGLAYIYDFDYKKGADAFGKALKIRPQYFEARNGFAYCFLGRGKLGGAEKEAKRSLEINQSNNADAYYILGFISLSKSDRAAALEHATRAIEQNPKLAAAYLLKSQALIAGPAGTIYAVARPDSSDVALSYTEAVGLIETYLRLTRNDESKKTWTDQLETLRIYIAHYNKTSSERDVYTGKQVSTKARLISKPEPSYTEQAKRNGITGTVVLRVVFAGDGVVKHVLVLQGLSHGLTERAIAAARKIEFIPATLDGRNVSMFIQLEYNFNLY